MHTHITFLAWFSLKGLLLLTNNAIAVSWLSTKMLDNYIEQNLQYLTKLGEGGLLLIARDWCTPGIQTGLQKLCCLVYEKSITNQTQQISFTPKAAESLRKMAGPA